MGKAPLEVARLHLLESGQQVDYKQIPVEQLAPEIPGSFDVVTCMEMLEHVPDPSICGQVLCRPDQTRWHCFFSTINRNPKSYMLAIIGAEYLLGLLPERHPRLCQVYPSSSSWINGFDRPAFKPGT